MTWNKSIFLDVTNKLFDIIEVSFEQNELEIGYLAKHEPKTIIRPTFCKFQVLYLLPILRHEG